MSSLFCRKGSVFRGLESGLGFTGQWLVRGMKQYIEEDRESRGRGSLFFFFKSAVVFAAKAEYMQSIGRRMLM